MIRSTRDTMAHDRGGSWTTGQEAGLVVGAFQEGSSVPRGNGVEHVQFLLGSQQPPAWSAGWTGGRRARWTALSQTVRGWIGKRVSEWWWWLCQLLLATSVTGISGLGLSSLRTLLLNTASLGQFYR